MLSKKKTLSLFGGSDEFSNFECLYLLNAKFCHCFGAHCLIDILKINILILTPPKILF